MEFGSLFSGIGGFDLANERAGMTCAWQAENDPAASAILARHWPNVKNIGDVHHVKRKTAKSVDLICGGFPCQDVSVAGNRAGLAGKRSGLWFQFERIIDRFRPGWVEIENVPGLLSSNEGRDFAVIVQRLAELGYGVAWRILDAQYFGLAQRRRRVFIIGHLGDGRAAQVLFEREGLPGNPPARRAEGQSSAFSAGQGSTADSLGYQDEQSPTLKGTASGLNQIPSVLSKPILGGSNNHNDESQQTYIVEQNNKVSTPNMISLRSNPAQPVIFQQNARDEVRLINGDGQIAGSLSAEPGMKQQNYIAGTLPASGAGLNRPAGQGNELDFLVMTHGQANAEIVSDGEPSLTDNHEAPIIFSIQHASIGRKNEAGPQAKGYRDDGAAWTLDNRGEADAITGSFGVRRLTPTECERLQGFPDGWTDGQADSARYRQLGNAVAVPVAEWIARRIILAERR